MKYENWMKIITLLLLALWVPIFIDKLHDYAIFEAGLLRQPLPLWLLHVLLWLLPLLEGAIVILLLINDSTRKWAMYLSFIMMCAFTVYIGLALAGYWKKVPCVCGSVIRFLTWKQHFIFNIAYTLLSAAGIYVSRKLQGQLSSRKTGQTGGPTKLAIK